MAILYRWVFPLIIAAGLAVDAWVHWDFAPDMAPGPGFEGIPGDDLFRAQAIAAAAAGVLLLAWANRWTYALAFLVAASAVGALLLYYYVDVGKIGPLPNMHDPSWYTEKTLSLASEGPAALLALVGMLLPNPRKRAERQDAFTPHMPYASR